MKKQLPIILTLCMACGGNTPSPSGVDHVLTDNYANKQLFFYYYIPGRLPPGPRPLIVCVPGLGGRGDLFVTPQITSFADEMGAVVISPSFAWDEANWASQSSYQYPEAWSGQAFLSMVDKVKKTHHLEFSKLHLMGMSAGAQFCLRFAVWRPEMCGSCAAFGSGGEVIPNSHSDVKFLVAVGREDIDDRKRHAQTFRESARNLHMDVEYREYEGGHSFTSAQVEEALAFFRGVLAGKN